MRLIKTWNFDDVDVCTTILSFIVMNNVLKLITNKKRNNNNVPKMGIRIWAVWGLGQRTISLRTMLPSLIFFLVGLRRHLSPSQITDITCRRSWNTAYASDGKWSYLPATFSTRGFSRRDIQFQPPIDCLLVCWSVCPLLIPSAQASYHLSGGSNRDVSMRLLRV